LVSLITVPRVPADLPALSALGVGNLFQVLDVAAAFWDGTLWRSIYAKPSVLDLEIEHGVVAERERYNESQLRAAWRSGRLVLGEHAGLCDLFAPVVARGRTIAVLATGPFATSRPTSAWVLERWRWLTSRQGHPADPEFVRFLDLTLGTLVLEGRHAQTFQRLVRHLTGLVTANAGDVVADYDDRRVDLEVVRSADRMWEAARSMLEPATTRSWSSSYLQPWKLGIQRLPDMALVGLIGTRDTKRDPVDELLERDALQRACVELSRSVGHMVAGRIGDRGLMLLSAAAGSLGRRRDRLLGLADRITGLARARRLRIHFGLGAPTSATLIESFQSAFAAAERALLDGARIVHATTGAKRPTFVLVDLERDLGRILGEGLGAPEAHVDRYLEAVGVYYGHRLDAVRTHLVASFERLAAELLDRGAIDEAGLSDLRPARDVSDRESATVADVLVAHRRALLGLADALRRPFMARRDRGLERALLYIRQHYAEALTLPAVARVAGFAPNYFSALFKKREKTTFERYLGRLRIERARLLLGQHEIAIQQVAYLSGFRERHYFSRAFRKAVGLAPTDYRRALREAHGSAAARITVAPTRAPSRGR
jgi:AraC-like DNA-binding protein